MIPESFIFLSALISIASGGSYIWETLRGRAQPNRATWIIWATAPMLTTAAQLAHGVGWPTLMAFMSALIALLVLAASAINPKAYWKLTSLDYICGALSLCGLVLWVITKHPVHGVIFSVLADALAALPTLVKSYREPESEDGRAYALAVLSATVAFLSIQHLTFVAYGFIAYNIIANAIITFFIYRHKLPKLFLLALLPSTLFLTACKPTPQQTTYTNPGPPAKGDVFNTAILGSPPNLVPYLAADSTAAAIAGNLYHALLTYDANLNLIPQLAEKFTVSPDNLTITFTLKPNLKFADGSPLTSADVSATFHALINPDTKTPYADDYLRVSKFETPDPRTIRITYAEPFAPAMASWAGLEVMPAKIIAQTKSFNDTPLKDHPLGSGPYQLKHWRRGQDFLLTENPNSFEHPYITQLYMRTLPDQSTQWLELKAGNLDDAALTPLAYTRLTEAPWFKNNYNTYRYLSSAYTYMGFNLKDPLFADKRVRQALSYAVDRQGLINAALFGQGEPLASIFKPGTWANNTNLKPYDYNPQKAQQLFAAAGWKKGPDGLLHNTKGETFHFTLTTNQGNETRLKTAQILQKFFADVGVQMDIRVQEWSTFLTNTINPRKFQTVLMGWTLPTEPDPFDVWHSSKTKPSEFNLVSFNNAEADKEIIASRSTFNQTERKKHLDRLQEILADEQPYLWLYAPYALEAVHKRIVGIVPAPAGIGYNSVDWYVPKEWQLRPLLQQ